MKLIAVNGFKRSGKDTTFTTIEGAFFQYNYPVARRAFADKLKVMAALALGLDGEPHELIELMDEFKETGWLDYGMSADTSPDGSITGRYYLQRFGDRARHVFGDTFWIDQVLPRDRQRFNELWATQPWPSPVNGPTTVAVLPNAAKPVTNMGFESLPFVGVITDLRYANEAERVLELGGEVWEILRPGLESDGHITEQPLPRALISRQFLNDGTLEQFKTKISEYVRAEAPNWIEAMR